MKNTKADSVDMLHGPLTLKIIVFALPVALSSMLQQLFNAADTSVVGHFADSDALAAVGTNGEIVALLVTLSAGLSVGANVLLARYIGEKKSGQISSAVHTALVLAGLTGCLGALLGPFISRPLLTCIQTPEEILDSAVLYLRIYFCGFPFLMLYDFGSAILRAKGNSRFPFIVLILSGILNVLLNLFFVIVCHAEVAGVAAATGISTAVAAFLVLRRLHLETDEFRLRMRALCLHKDDLTEILMIGIPAAVQGSVFCLANIFVQASVNSFGAIATAGSTIAMNFEYFGYFIITAFGQAATTFTSQNAAAGNGDRCRRILRICLLSSFFFSALITVPLTLFRSAASGLFSTDPAVIEAAGLRIGIILLFEPICGFYETPAGVLRGIGHSTLPALVTIIGTCLLRIVWIFTGFRSIHTPESLFVIFPVSWAVTICLMLFLLHRSLRKCCFHPQGGPKSPLYPHPPASAPHSVQGMLHRSDIPLH